MTYTEQAGSGPPSVAADYAYDADDQRVKKVVERQGEREVTVYIDGLFEYRRREFDSSGRGTRENDTIHVTGANGRIALERIGQPLDPSDSSPAVRYRHADHIESSTLVVDDDGNWIDYEEFTPFGETAFGGYASKRYRFTGRERDEESGLYYHGKRYYVPWLCRWSTTDPAGPRDGLNTYPYASNNPIRANDPTGTQKNEGDQNAGSKKRRESGNSAQEESEGGASDDQGDESESGGTENEGEFFGLRTERCRSLMSKVEGEREKNIATLLTAAKRRGNLSTKQYEVLMKSLIKKPDKARDLLKGAAARGVIKKKMAAAVYKARTMTPLYWDPGPQGNRPKAYARNGNTISLKESQRRMKMRLKTGSMVSNGLGAAVAYIISQGGVFGTGADMDDPDKVYHTTRLGKAVEGLLPAARKFGPTKTGQGKINWGGGDSTNPGANNPARNAKKLPKSNQAIHGKKNPGSGKSKGNKSTKKSTSTKKSNTGPTQQEMKEKVDHTKMRQSKENPVSKSRRRIP